MVDFRGSRGFRVDFSTGIVPKVTKSIKYVSKILNEIIFPVLKTLGDNNLIIFFLKRGGQGSTPVQASVNGQCRKSEVSAEVGGPLHAQWTPRRSSDGS